MKFKEWCPGFTFTELNLNKDQIWVNIYELDMESWSADAISRIISYIGVLIILDSITEDKKITQYAKYCLRSPESTLPKIITVQLRTAVKKDYKSTYDYLPPKCTKCQLVSHKEKFHHKDTTPKWVLKNPTSSADDIPEQSNKMEEQ